MYKLLSAASITSLLLLSLTACKPGVYMDLRPEAVKQRQLQQQQQHEVANPATTQARVNASQQRQQNKANLVVAS